MRIIFQIFYKSCDGYTNQLHHLAKAHPNYAQLAETAFRQGNRLGLSVPDQRTSDIFRWIEWCVVDGMPVSFCERPLVRKNAKIQPITASTLQRHIDGLYLHVRDVVAAALPERFGLVLDGWTSGGRHFVAILAVYDDPSLSQLRQRNPAYDDGVQCLSRRFVLLAFCPLADETDLSAQSLYDLIADTLSTFDKPWEAVLFLIGDHCSVNQAIGRKEGALSFIGCASHRFQLAVSDF